MQKNDLNVTLLMAMSINGMIAEPNDKVPWTQPIWDNFFALVKDYGSLIIGRRTYEEMLVEGELAKIGDIPVAVLSRTPRPPEGRTVFVKNAQEALAYIAGKGLKRTLVGGGASIALLFLTSRLVNDIILDIDPILMAQGIPLLASMPWTRRPKFVEAKPLGGDCVRLQYRFED